MYALRVGAKKPKEEKSNAYIGSYSVWPVRDAFVATKVEWMGVEKAGGMAYKLCLTQTK